MWRYKQKKTLKASFIVPKMVPGVGVEPTWIVRIRGILSPLRLPISPPGLIWRRVPESNRTIRICNPLYNRFTNTPYEEPDGAGNGARIRDPNHGKVMLYQLSYSRVNQVMLIIRICKNVSRKFKVKLTNKNKIIKKQYVDKKSILLCI